jgi:hypothetical protein
MAARESARKVITTLLDAYGSMIFEHGLFHADPHPGAWHPLGFATRCSWGHLLHNAIAPRLPRLELGHEDC